MEIGFFHTGPLHLSISTNCTANRPHIHNNCCMQTAGTLVSSSTQPSSQLPTGQVCVGQSGLAQLVPYRNAPDAHLVSKFAPMQMRPEAQIPMTSARLQGSPGLLMTQLLVSSAQDGLLLPLEARTDPLSCNHFILTLLFQTAFATRICK